MQFAENIYSVMNESNVLLNVAISRLHFLNTTQKILLSENLDNLDSMALLSKIDLERICSKSLKEGLWKPDLIIARAERDFRLMHCYGIQLVSWQDSRYPFLLRQISQPPYALYVRGNSDALAGGRYGKVGIVGTRRPDGAGIQAAFNLARDCAAAGITVVSGLAAGIDTAAHRGALAAVTDVYAPDYCGPWTIAVCGTGLDQMYPSANKKLAVQIMRRGGCLISEYPPETPGTKWTFPERNRIISGLCFGVSVVEAPAKSGSLITADFALEQGRELFLHPVGVQYSSRIDTPNDTRTVQSLMLDGATVTDSVHDILPHWIAETEQMADKNGQLTFDL